MTECLLIILLINQILAHCLHIICTLPLYYMHTMCRTVRATPRTRNVRHNVHPSLRAAENPCRVARARNNVHRTGFPLPWETVKTGGNWWKLMKTGENWIVPSSPISSTRLFLGAHALNLFILFLWKWFSGIYLNFRGLCLFQFCFLYTDNDLDPLWWQCRQWPPKSFLDIRHFYSHVYYIASK